MRVNGSGGNRAGEVLITPPDENVLSAHFHHFIAIAQA
jgi:hypothetical protein